jgi:hypothetical protein
MMPKNTKKKLKELPEIKQFFITKSRATYKVNFMMMMCLLQRLIKNCREFLWDFIEDLIKIAEPRSSSGLERRDLIRNFIPLKQACPNLVT